MGNEVELDAKKIYKRKMFIRLTKIVFLLLLILISLIYLILYIVYDGGRFTISLDKNLANRKNIYLSEDGSVKNKAIELSADTINYMDNISIKWLPKDLDKHQGSHNGDNYIAYSFYIINNGKEKVNYWYEVNIDDTIKNVDEAIRIMIIHRGKTKVYAKKSPITNKNEPGTISFESNKVPMLKQRKNFKPNEKDKFTIVVWIEGDDPECKNELLGGEVKMHMDIVEEHIDQKEKRRRFYYEK